MNRAINAADDDPQDQKKLDHANHLIREYNKAGDAHNKALDQHKANLITQISKLKGHA